MIAFIPGGYGTFMFGSIKPICVDESSIREVLARPGVLADLAGAVDSPASAVDAWVHLIPDLVWIAGADVARFAGKGPLITDDRPITEYFLLRRLTGPVSAPMTAGTLRAALNPAGLLFGARNANKSDNSDD